MTWVDVAAALTRRIFGAEPAHDAVVGYSERTRFARCKSSETFLFEFWKFAFVEYRRMPRRICKLFDPFAIFILAKNNPTNLSIRRIP